jgi:CheY-like chemotaxis protein
MKSLHILLVEDNEGDIVLTTEALEESKVVNKVTVLRDGKAAIDFFETLTDLKNLPDLVLLDINLPKKNGHEVLQHIKKNEHHNQVPVIMLTTSTAERDVLLAHKYHVNGYITKPMDVGGFISAIAKSKGYLC